MLMSGILSLCHSLGLKGTTSVLSTHISSTCLILLTYPYYFHSDCLALSEQVLILFRSILASPSTSRYDTLPPSSLLNYQNALPSSFLGSHFISLPSPFHLTHQWHLQSRCGLWMCLWVTASLLSSHSVKCQNCDEQIEGFENYRAHVLELHPSADPFLINCFWLRPLLTSKSGRGD